VWCVQAYTDVLAAGHAQKSSGRSVVKDATKRGWVSEKRAEKWLKKLEKSRVLREGLPEYEVRQSSGGALTAKFGSTNPGNVMWEVRRLRDIGLEEGRHFSVEMPGEGREGYVYVRGEGLSLQLQTTAETCSGGGVSNSGGSGCFDMSICRTNQ
jgi:hypothetical protein